MKNILTITLILCSFMGIGQSSTQTLGNTSNYVKIKGMGGADSVLLLPRYADTISANSYSNFRDTCGKLMYTYNTGDVWKRICNPLRWAKIGVVDSTIFATQSWVIQGFVAIQTLPPTSTLTGGTTVELMSAGSAVDTLYWGAGRQSAGTGQNPTANLSSIVVGGVTQTFTNPAVGASVTGKQAVTVTNNTNTTFNNVVTTTDGKSATSSTTFSFLPRYYIGFSTSSSPSDVTLQGIGGNLTTSKAASGTTGTPTGAQYLVFAFPANEGTLSSIAINGLQVTYNLTTRNVTNASGYTQSYNIYVSPNPTNSSVTYSVN